MRISKNFIKQSLFHLFFFISLALITGCGTLRRINYKYHHTYMPVSSKNYGFTTDYPRSFTVYPFKNTSWYQESAERGREATFEAFSLIGSCASMEETDRLASTPYSAPDAIKVAKKQKSDAVIIGEVLAQDHIWLLVVAYSYVKVKLSIYSTRDGTLLWTGSNWSISNWGYPILTPLLITPIEAGVEHVLWSRVTSDLYHRINMDFIHALRPDVLAVK